MPGGPTIGRTLRSRPRFLHFRQAAPSRPATRNKWLGPSWPKASSASFSSLIRECHCRCKATSCFHVNKTSSGAASAKAPRRHVVTPFSSRASGSPTRGRQLRRACGGRRSLRHGNKCRSAGLQPARLSMPELDLGEFLQMVVQQPGWFSTACRIRASRVGIAVRWPRWMALVMLRGCHDIGLAGAAGVGRRG